MGFFKPAEEAEETDEAPNAGDEGGDGLGDPGVDEGSPEESAG